MKLSQSKEFDSQRGVKHIEVEKPEVLVDNPEYKIDSDALEASLAKSDAAQPLGTGCACAVIFSSMLLLLVV